MAFMGDVNVEGVDGRADIMRFIETDAMG